MITEPQWKSLLATTVGPLFTPVQCQNIIDIGHQQQARKANVGQPGAGPGGAKDLKMRVTTISWIPFKTMPEMYAIIERSMKQVNGNHFGYEGMQLTEYGQFTEYPKGGFYDWHIDGDISCKYEPPVRKISMTVLLSDPSEFEGGDLQFMAEGNEPPQLLQGQAIFFCRLIRRRVARVKKGIRRSLVMWFGGPPFK